MRGYIPERAKKMPKKANSRFILVTILCLAVVFMLAIGLGLNLPGWLSEFEYSTNDVVTLVGNPVSADAFISNDYNNGTMAVFSDEVNFFRTGMQEVSLNLRRGFRTQVAYASMFVLELRDSVVFEFAETAPYISPWDFVLNRHILSDESAVNIAFVGQGYFPWQVGEFVIGLVLEENLHEVQVIVEDTTPPEVRTVAEVVIAPGDAVSATDFIEEIFDFSEITRIELLHELDLFTPGNQVVFVLVADEWDNETVVTSRLYVLENDVPPVIEGVQSLEVMLGNPVLYRQGVTATDALGRNIFFEIDNSAVDLTTPGEYSVIYSATDAWGNRSEIETTVFILSIDPEYVYERVDVILAQILRPDMTQVQEARAIYNWVSANIRFTSDVRRDSVYEAAHAALTNRSGNCFAFFGISHVMLTRAGIPSLRIDRIPGAARTNHRWNLINPDGLGWHHFDSTPVTGIWDTFMFTSTQAREFSERLSAVMGRANYFLYDPDLYPDIVQ